VSNNFYNRYGEYDPDHADMKKWIGRCVECGEWLQTGEPIKTISIQELAHKFCPTKIIKENR